MVLTAAKNLEGFARSKSVTTNVITHFKYKNININLV